ncbi:hypothetical protein EVB81_253 [Rhizobium phage RHph_I46]|uniref:DUF7831 domain-containing protein n=1 Tax=Rhizobium phage RHph_I1_9 TaxID=2509729 RepID=A0A7S5UZR4_9CAUD|nr:hypothetical protein PP936_gp251 [Rhizobium phage RHph_I1_9]QIG69822.1 hypothetical protein EVB81_253 [Rhizobium phage RHph_I46]QIG71103.1 hypothetical protein EVB92_253 [Rhizobium phage RHph_I9]QIG73688.1 hypothetical protein EVC04_251 [Rhizobium phage RHph_I1_9]QIG76442.1 hypothetical protein EVC25_253 [Rhizobium phage RHph_I34]
MPIAYFEQTYTIELLDSMPDCYFVFGDNMKRKGYRGQAEIRECANAIGVVTKYLPSKASFAYITDNDYNNVVPIILSDLQKIEDLLEQDKTVYWPIKGIGTGRAKLYRYAPRVFEVITKKRDEFFRKYPKRDTEKFHDLF